MDYEYAPNPNHIETHCKFCMATGNPIITAYIESLGNMERFGACSPCLKRVRAGQYWSPTSEEFSLIIGPYRFKVRPGARGCL